MSRIDRRTGELKPHVLVQKAFQHKYCVSTQAIPDMLAWLIAKEEEQVSVLDLVRQARRLTDTSRFDRSENAAKQMLACIRELQEMLFDNIDGRYWLAGAAKAERILKTRLADRGDTAGPELTPTAPTLYTPEQSNREPESQPAAGVHTERGEHKPSHETGNRVDTLEGRPSHP